MKDDSKFIRNLYGKYLISSFAALFGGIMAQIINNIMIGNFLGQDFLAITNITLPIYYFFTVAGAMIGVGGATACAKRIGRGDHNGSREIFTVTYILTLIVGIVLTLIVVFNLDNILSIINVSEELYRNAYDYSLMTSLGGLFIMAIYPAFNFLRLDGRVKLSALLFILMAIINVVLDYIFLGVLDCGIGFVSLSSTISMAAATISGALFLFFGSKNFCYKKVTSFVKKTVEICLIGSTSAAENISILLRCLLLNVMIINMLGAVTLSLFSVVGSINSFATILIASVSGSIVPLIGVFSTEKDIQSMKQVLRLAFFIGSIIVFIFTILCIVFASQISILFGIKDYINESANAVIIFSLSFLFSMLNNILIALYISNDQLKLANIMTLIKSLIFPVAFAFFLTKSFSANGFWNSFWIVEVIVFALFILISLIYHIKNKNLTILTLIDRKPEIEGKYLSFSLHNKSEEISYCSEEIKDFCMKNGLNGKRTMTLSLALEEMLTLIGEYSLKAYPEMKMNVRILIHNNIVILRIRNGGCEFDPITYYKNKQITNESNNISQLDDLDDSFGIGLILKITDVVEYQRTFGENNLTIIL